MKIAGAGKGTGNFLEDEKVASPHLDSLPAFAGTTPGGTCRATTIRILRNTPDVFYSEAGEGATPRLWFASMHLDRNPASY